MEKTLAFYQQLLQFVVVNKREKNDELCWAHIMHGDITVMLRSVDQLHPEPDSTTESNITLYFFVNNINELHHYIKAKYNDVSEVIETDYQTFEFDLTDPEGNTVTIGQKS
jgi:uncharacterized glyoxalase superfamily protein PhnB